MNILQMHRLSDPPVIAHLQTTCIVLSLVTEHFSNKESEGLELENIP